VEIWLNDGGAIGTWDRIGDSWSWAQSKVDQIKHKQDMQRKQSSANGSRVCFRTDQLPASSSVDDFVIFVSEHASKFFEIADAKATAEALPAAAAGLIMLTAEPKNQLLET
jgi:hypothetical protein